MSFDGKTPSGTVPQDGENHKRIDTSARRKPAMVSGTMTVWPVERYVRDAVCDW